MDEIRPWLFIGSIRDTANEGYLAYKSIQAMLQLAAKVSTLKSQFYICPLRILRRLIRICLRRASNLFEKIKSSDIAFSLLVARASTAPVLFVRPR
jgi:hypothetical protein